MDQTSDGGSSFLLWWCLIQRQGSLDVDGGCYLGILMVAIDQRSGKLGLYCDSEQMRFGWLVKCEDGESSDLIVKWLGIVTLGDEGVPMLSKFW